MSNLENYYHHPNEPGYWTDKDLMLTSFVLTDNLVLESVGPVGIEERGGTLVLVLSTFEGDIPIRVDKIPGLRVVTGDSANNPYEKDGELLIEIRYLKIDKMESKPRRIRPTSIKFGIKGDTEKASAERGDHRAMGESADFYLEGQDTQYNPDEDTNEGLRAFPFWRIGVWGDPQELVEEYLPQAPTQTA